MAVVLPAPAGPMPASSRCPPTANRAANPTCPCPSTRPVAASTCAIAAARCSSPATIPAGWRAARTNRSSASSRAARLHLDAERESRDRAIESAAAGYFTAADKRAGLLEQVRVVEAETGASVEALRGPGEPAGRIAQLLGIDLKDVRRYQVVASNDARDGDRSDAATVPIQSPAA